jgi:ComF family protein
MQIIEDLISTLAPHRCLACGVEGAPLCRPCYSTVPRTGSCCYKCASPAKNGICMNCYGNTPLQSVATGTTYTGVAKQLLHCLKFERMSAVAKTVAALMPCLPAEEAVITHIPTAASRVRLRGYDQARLIAKHLSKRSQIHHRTLLTRINQDRQLGKGRTDRERQMTTAFEAKPRLLSRTTPVYILDDVLTTGATLEAAARCLSQAGYENIRALVFARVK